MCRQSGLLTAPATAATATPAAVEAVDEPAGVLLQCAQFQHHGGTASHCVGTPAALPAGGQGETAFSGNGIAVDGSASVSVLPAAQLRLACGAAQYAHAEELCNELPAGGQGCGTRNFVHTAASATDTTLRGSGRRCHEGVGIVCYSNESSAQRNAVLGKQ